VTFTVTNGLARVQASVVRDISVCQATLAPNYRALVNALTANGVEDDPTSTRRVIDDADLVHFLTFRYP
jgi:hypothetical protein